MTNVIGLIFSMIQTHYNFICDPMFFSSSLLFLKEEWPTWATLILPPILIIPSNKQIPARSLPVAS
jgi:hypothetical protein